MIIGEIRKSDLNCTLNIRLNCKQTLGVDFWEADNSVWMSMWHSLLCAPVADTAWGITPPSLCSNCTFINFYFLALMVVFGCWKKEVVIQPKAGDSVHLRRDQADVLEQIPLVVTYQVPETPSLLTLE